MDSEKKYIAKKRLRIGNGYRNIGELVPEANSWPNSRNWISGGYIELVEEDTKPSIKPIVTKPAVELAKETKKETKEVEERELASDKVEFKDDQVDEDSHECDICDRTFLTEPGLKRHKTRTH